MSIQLIVPTLGESITEATVSKWLKKIGEPFEIDEPIVEIETDKITVEVPAPSAGVLEEIKVKEGTDINIGGVLGIIGDSNSSKIISKDNKGIKHLISIFKSRFKKRNLQKEEKVIEEKKEKIELKNDSSKLSPSVKKMIAENNIKTDAINSKREDGRLTKEDVINFMNDKSSQKFLQEKEKKLYVCQKLDVQYLLV